MGTLTINTTAPEDAKLQAAAGNALNLGGSANGAQTKAWAIEVLKRATQAELDDIKRKSIVYDTPINPT